jgi:cyclic pyranopterin phosphate synthase
VVPEAPEEVSDTASDDRSRPLTHVDGAGRARMVDVSRKPWTHRRAVARCKVRLHEARGPDDADGSMAAMLPGRAWAEVLGAARLAGIQAAKQTARLVPLCHPLAISEVDVRLAVSRDGVEIEGEAQTVGPTGVEMEALTACAFAALTLVSVLGEDGTDLVVEDLALWEKSGGRSGNWARH